MRSALLAGATVVAVLGSGCHGGQGLAFVEEPWSAGATAIVVLIDPRGMIVDPSPIIVMPGDTAKLPVDVREGLRVHAWVYDGSASQAIAACGVAIGGAYGRLPSPAATYASKPFDPPSAGSVSLELAPPLEGIELRYRSCEGAELTCVAPEIQLIPVPRRLWKVALVAPELAIFGSEPFSYLPLMRLEGGTFTQLEAGLISGNVVGLGYDQQRDIVFGASTGPGEPTDPGMIFEVDPSGVITSTRGAGIPMRGITAGKDGSVFAFSPLEILDVTSSAAVPMHPMGATTSSIVDFLVVRRDRMVLLTNDEILVQENGVWTKERDLSHVESLGHLIGDDQILVAAGRRSTILKRDESPPHDWTMMDSPFAQSGIHIETAVPLGGGRLLVAGLGGSISIWNGSRWCEMNTGLRGPTAGASVSPDGTIVLITTMLGTELARLDFGAVH